MTERRKVTKEEFCKMLLDARGKKYAPVYRDIRNISVEDMDLANMDFSRTAFINVDFSRAKCARVKASLTTFKDCIFDGAHFDGELNGSWIIDCSLNDAYIAYTNMSEAAIERCTITNTYVSYCDLRRCRIENNTISDIKLNQDDFKDAEIAGSNTVTGITRDIAGLPPLVCPESGSFVAYKRAQTVSGNPVIIKLLIPEDAKRSSATTRKCRASKAKVLEFYKPSGELISAAKLKRAYSSFNSEFKYERGETVEPLTQFCENRWEECAPGIHFFITFKEAVEYGHL